MKLNILIFETGWAILGSSDILSFYTSSCNSCPFRPFAGNVIEIVDQLQIVSSIILCIYISIA